MPTDYHSTDPISVRPIARDLTWANEYAKLHGMSRSSVYNQALAAFRMQGDAAGWNAADLFDMLRVVLEAVEIPYAATVGDEDIRLPILDDRVMILVVSLRAMIERGPDHSDPKWTANYVREQLKKHPATGYKTEYAQVIAERDGITVEAAREQLAGLRAAALDEVSAREVRAGVEAAQ